MEIVADYFTGTFNGTVSGGAGSVSAPTFAATTGTLPTPGGSTTFANASSPTVAELLDAVVELRKSLADLITQLS